MKQPEKFTARLPPAVVTPTMKRNLFRRAKKDKKTASELIRIAVENFLSEHAREEKPS